MVGYPPIPLLKYCWLFITPLILWVIFLHFSYFFYLIHHLCASSLHSSSVTLSIIFFILELNTDPMLPFITLCLFFFLFPSLLGFHLCWVFQVAHFATPVIMHELTYKRSDAVFNWKCGLICFKTHFTANMSSRIAKSTVVN